MTHLTIIGAGLAGSEAAWQAAERGVHVTLYEMRPTQKTDAHHSGHCAELVCSNSFRSDDTYHNAVGLLHEEMRRCGSLIMRCADAHKVPAGGALAVDRDAFASAVSAALAQHERITIKREEMTTIPNADQGKCIIATGPLTSAALTDAILSHTGEAYLAFFDAIAPIITRDSINMEQAWFQSRYDKLGPDGTGKDYINCPMDQTQYHAFIQALLEGEKMQFKEWEKNTPYFEGCLPVEVMAERGIETLRYGPMKPVGLTNPHKTEKPYAVVQLRQDNKLGTLYNMVGFQTKLKWGEQTKDLSALAVPVRIDGTFANPSFSPDTKSALQTLAALKFGTSGSQPVETLIGSDFVTQHTEPSCIKNINQTIQAASKEDIRGSLKQLEDDVKQDGKDIEDNVRGLRDNIKNLKKLF